MAHQTDPVDEVLDAYFDFLEHGGDEPSLDHLTPAERTEADQLIASLKAGRGMDPSASRPSLASLLSHEPTGTLTRDIANVASSLEAELHQLMAGPCDVVVDVAALATGIGSDLIIVCRGQRLRAILEPANADLSNLTPERLSAAAAIFGAFSDTAGVLLVTEPPMMGVIVERSDLESAIEVPHGEWRPARIFRPIAPAAAACAAFISELVPSFSPLDTGSIQPMDDGVATLDISAIVEASLLAVAKQGARAQIVEKRTAWSALGDREAAALTRLISDVETGVLSPDDLPERLDEIARARAA